MRRKRRRGTAASLIIVAHSQAQGVLKSIAQAMSGSPDKMARYGSGQVRACGASV